MPDQLPPVTVQVADFQQLLTQLRAAIVVPQERRLWGMAEIADYSGYSISTVQQRICCKPNFPKAIRVDAGAQPRWVAAEVMGWFEERKS